MIYSLSLSGIQHKKLKTHLIQKDGLEAMALILCYRSESEERIKFIASKIIFIANQDCFRTANKITWNTKKYLSSHQITEMDKNDLSLITIHSHPSGFNDFSKLDDDNDKILFASVNNWFDDSRPNGARINHFINSFSKES